MDINFLDYIKPELLVLIPVMYLIGGGIKKSTYVKDNFIPLILGLVSVVLAVIYVLATTPITGYREGLMAAFVAITQGVLCAGASVYVNQLAKQARK